MNRSRSSPGRGTTRRGKHHHRRGAWGGCGRGGHLFKPTRGAKLEVLRKDSRPARPVRGPWASISSPPCGGFRKTRSFAKRWPSSSKPAPHSPGYSPGVASAPGLPTGPSAARRSACSALRLRLKSWVLPRPKASRLGLASPYAIWCHQQNKRPGSEQQCGASRGPPPYQRASRGRSAPSAALAYLVEEEKARPAGRAAG